MGFSWLDGLIILIVVVLVLIELRRDLGQTLFDTIALLVALRLALWLGPSMAGTFGSATSPHARGLAMLLIFVVVAAVGLIIGFYVHTMTRWTMDSFDPVAGLMLGFSSAVIVCHVLVASLALMFATPKATTPAFVKQSPLGREVLSFHSFHRMVTFFDRLI